MMDTPNLRDLTIGLTRTVRDMLRALSDEELVKKYYSFLKREGIFSNLKDNKLLAILNCFNAELKSRAIHVNIIE